MLFTEALDVSRSLGGHLLSAIGNVLKGSDDQDGAMDYYRQSLDVYRRECFTP